MYSVARVSARGLRPARLINRNEKFRIEKNSSAVVNESEGGLLDSLAQQYGKTH
eukprot:COSAG02_NODE_1460_length_12494_cov_126.207422_3_plen_54_part_00